MDGTLECEVLEAGTHNGVTFSTDDLDAMAQNFDALKDHIKPPLKLGHEDAQLLAGQKDGDPALGWVSGLRRAGSKLIATVQNVPQRLVELIQKRRYRRVSSEVLLKFEQTAWEKNLATGRKGKVLSAVALLGADVPAVASLEDLTTWLASDASNEPLRVDGPRGALALSADGADSADGDEDDMGTDSKRCPECGGRMEMNAQNKRVCLNGNCGGRPPRILASDAATRRSEVAMADEANITALTAELEALKAKQAERDAKDAEAATAQARLAAELETLKAKAADAERRAEQAAAMQRSLEADAFVERNSKQDCLRLVSAEARDRARALYVKLATQGEAIVSEAESVTLKLSSEPRTFTAVQLLEAFVESLPDQKVLMTATAKPGKPDEPESYEALKAKLAADLKIDTTTAEGRATLMRHVTEAVKKDPSKYGFRAKE